MAITCSKCGSLNPHGAEICGDCGEALAADSEPAGSQDNQLPPPQLAKEIERLPEIPILSKAKKPKAPIAVQILSGALFASGVFLCALFIILPLTDNLSFLQPHSLSPYSSYRILLPLIFFCVGLYTIFVGYGISNLKKWAINTYISWALIQVILMILARVYHGRLGLNYSPIVLGELIIIPFLWRIKHRFFY